MCFIHKEALLFKILILLPKIPNASQANNCTTSFLYAEKYCSFNQVSLFHGETFCIILKNSCVPGKLFQFSEMIIFTHSPSKTIYQAVEDNEP